MKKNNAEESKMARRLALLFALALMLLASASANTQTERKAELEKSAASLFDGVWEQVEVQAVNGKLAYWPKIIMFNHGTESLWAIPHGRGPLVKPQKLTVGEKGVFEFVNQNDNLTIRGLYEFSDKGSLKMCWRDDYKTLIRPERLTPLPERCAYHLFRRLTFVTDPGTERDKELAGLWYMTAMAEDGELIEKRDFDHTFENREIAVYVHEDHLLLLKPKDKEPYLEIIHARLQLRPKERERTADIKFSDGSVAQAIYAISEDRLSFCWTKNGKRPDQFSTEKGDGRSVYRLKRAFIPK